MTTAAAKPKPEWTPRLWQGCDLFAWLRLLVRNHFAVHPPYWHIAAVATVASLMNSTLRLLTDGVYGGPSNRTPIREAPLFIVGHWRTGTTLLHELLILDPRHTFPNYYQCLAPHHFLLTERLPAAVLVPDAVAAADGQHGGRMGQAAGGRVRPVHARPAVAVPDHRLPQPPAAGSGGLRPRTAAARAPGCVEAGLPALPPRPDLQGPAPPRPQVADAQLPHQDAAGTVSRRPLRPHRPRSLCRFPVHGQPVEVALPKPRPANADVRRPGRTRLPDLQSSLCEAGGGQAAGRAGIASTSCVTRT